MIAIRVEETGGPEILRPAEVETPEPGEGEVRVRLAAAGLNFIDVYHRRGLYPLETPFVPGKEGAGTVDAVGPGVTRWAEGDRVGFALGTGAYAEAAVVDGERLVPVPEDVSLETAAAVLLQGMTAHYLAIHTFPLNEGDDALIHAGAGGVGQLLIQIAKGRGARVLATVSTEEKAELARRAGADVAIRYTESDFVEETRKATGGKGVDVVYDSVGKDTYEGSLECLKPRGTLALYGQASGPVPPLDPQVLNRKGSLFLTRPSLAHYVAGRRELLGRARDLFRWIADGELEVRIDRTFPLADAADAHRYIEGRKTKGKVLLVP